MKKKFPAALLSLHPILDWTRSLIEKTTLSKEEIRRMEIALEEALVNIFSYAYPNEKGMVEVSIEHKDAKYIQITIQDQGVPFNPLEYTKNIDALAPIDTIKEGGLGILFMQKFVDQIEYRREKNKNSISLKKNLKSE